MEKIQIGTSGIDGSRIALGCMRISQLPYEKAAELIRTAIEEGIDFFDHADIYGNGASEEMFAQVMKRESIQREDIVIQSKCGIRDGFFDFSKEHILEAVDGCLTRLNVEYLDFLLLHRPDTLMEPEEVAAAFDLLEVSGKVRHFGVSNQKPMQIELLRRYIEQPLVANQLQFGIGHSQMVGNGFNVNMMTDDAIERDGSILEYCRLHDITIQPWSPFQYGFFEGVFLDNPEFPELNQVLGQLAEQYQVTKTTIATAWILRHPAKMQPIVGTMNPTRLREICGATNITLTRKEWYDVYKAAGHVLP